MKSTDVKVAFNLPPERAMAFLGAKGLQTSGGWQEIWQEAHARTFTVANCHKLDVLQDIHTALTDALKNGTTYAKFQDTLKPLLQQKGWWGKAIDPKTGEITATYPNSTKPIQYGSPRRLQLIFDSNVRSAYMAGKYTQFKRTTLTHPYWMYTAILDGRTRPSHRSLHGRVFKHDDTVWQSIWPPNGFRCRCTVINLMQTDMDAQGHALSDSSGYVKQVEVPVSKRNPEAGTATVTQMKLPGMDRAFRTDPGWSSNQALAAYQPQLNKYAYPVAHQYVRGALKGPAFERFFNGASLENFPVAVLKPEDMKAIGALTQTVYLSAESLASHVAKHPEISLTDYQKIPDIIDKGEVYQQGDARLVFLAEDGVLYRAALKRTKDGGENYFLTLFKSNDDNAGRQVRKKLVQLR
ncbi:phage minor head protein [Undibacterium sp. Ren11W]|uniref:phage head morphogenesis protein n=1 Tax=Undibacterium sp. Ren11W TaxID=3413045 RepID=UPI003BEF7D6F